MNNLRGFTEAREPSDRNEPKSSGIQQPNDIPTDSSKFEDPKRERLRRAACYFDADVDTHRLSLTTPTTRLSNPTTHQKNIMTGTPATRAQPNEPDEPSREARLAQKPAVEFALLPTVVAASAAAGASCVLT